MKTVSYILWGLAVVSLIAIAFEASMIWVASPLLALAMTYTLVHICLYRPPEDHLGIIYRFGRLSRLVEDDEWVCLIPGVVHEIKEPICLHVRQVEVNLSDVLTQDRVSIDSKLLVFYSRDLRPADADFRSQALRIPETGWERIITTIVQETFHEVVGGIPFQQLLTPGGRGRLKRILSTLLGERVRHLGVVVSHQTGVSLQVLKPADTVWQAMLDQLAAVSLGEAARVRIRPILEELSQQRPEVGWDALLMEWAGVVAKDGSVPQVLVTPVQGLGQTVLAGTKEKQIKGRLATGGSGIGPNRERDGSIADRSARIRGVPRS